MCIKQYIQDCWSGAKFSNVPDIEFQEWDEHWEEKSDHELWLEISRILSIVFWWTVEQPPTYKPNMKDTIFRFKGKKQLENHELTVSDDFFANTWGHFIEYWRPFINLLDDEYDKDRTLDLLMFGADTWSGSTRVSVERPVPFRSKRKLLATVPVYSVDAQLRYRGRNRAQWAGKYRPRKFVRRGIVTYKDHWQPAVGKPVGHRPVPLHQMTPTPPDVGIFKNSAKTLQCQETVAGQFKVWLQMRAVELVCTVDKLPDNKDKVNTILPTVVEVKKPRVCIDGGPHKAVGSIKKLDCKLDTIQEVLQILKPGALLTKCDDKNGTVLKTMSKAKVQVSCTSVLTRSQGRCTASNLATWFFGAATGCLSASGTLLRTFNCSTESQQMQL